MQPRHTRRAFTLVELLVVISVIAVLIALLLPALASARRAAQLSVCGGQQRQVLIAQAAYAADAREHFPFGRLIHDSGADRLWDDELVSYLGNTAMTAAQKDKQDATFSTDPASADYVGLVRTPVLRCPADEAPRPGGRVPVSYRMVGGLRFGSGQWRWVGMAAEVDLRPAATFGGDRPSPLDATRGATAMKLSDATRASDTFLIAERTSWDDTLGSGAPTYLSAALAGSAGNQLLDKAGNRTATLHGSKSTIRTNYGYVDGHVKTLDPYQTLGNAVLEHYSTGPWTRNPAD